MFEYFKKRREYNASKGALLEKLKQIEMVIVATTNDVNLQPQDRNLILRSCDLQIDEVNNQLDELKKRYFRE